MQGFLKKIKQSEFAVNVAKLATGTTIAQAISILTAPILYRIYDKADYGTLSLYMAITGVVGVFSTMQYTQAVILEKTDDDAKKIMWLNRVINIGIALLVALLLIPIHSYIGKWFNNPMISGWVFLIPITIFFSGQNEIFRIWANRKKEYNLMSFNAILTAILVPIVSISVGLIKNGPLGLFLGLLVSQVIPPAVLLIGLARKEDLGLKYFDKTIMIEKAREFRNFPIYSLPSEFINRLTNQLPVFMLSTYAGAGVVGLYSLCVRMLGLPISLIGGAISSVFQQKASHDYNETGSFRNIFVKTFKTLSVISIVPFVILLLFAPDLFSFVFGEAWRMSGEMARILCGMYLMKLIASPLSFAFIIKNKLKEDLFWHIWMLISNAMLFYLGFKLLGDSKKVIFIFSINYITIYLLYLIRSYKFSIYQDETKQI